MTRSRSWAAWCYCIAAPPVECPSRDMSSARVGACGGGEDCAGVAPVVEAE